MFICAGLPGFRIHYLALKNKELWLIMVIPGITDRQIICQHMQVSVQDEEIVRHIQLVHHHTGLGNVANTQSPS